jgi:hypothetical protein
MEEGIKHKIAVATGVSSGPAMIQPQDGDITETLYRRIRQEL